MKDLVIRFFLAFFSYFLGETLTAATFPQGMDFGLPFWAVIKDMLHIEYYGEQRIAIVAVISALLLIADRVASKNRIHLAGLAIFAAFAGGYYYQLPYIIEFIDRLFPVDNSEPGFLVNAAADVFGMISVLLMVTFPMILLVACKAIAALFRRRHT